MQAELKQKWIDALRSGKYKQGRSMLRNAVKDSYCCLGVLCEVAELPERKWTNWCTLDGSGHSHLVDPRGTYYRDKLAAMNDEGFGFGAIADWIEANVPTE